MKIAKVIINCFLVLVCVIGFLWASESDYQDQLAAEEFYNER